MKIVCVELKEKTPTDFVTNWQITLYGLCKLSTLQGNKNKVRGHTLKEHTSNYLVLRR